MTPDEIFTLMRIVNILAGVYLLAEVYHLRHWWINLSTTFRMLLLGAYGMSLSISLGAILAIVTHENPEPAVLLRMVGILAFAYGAARVHRQVRAMESKNEE